MTKEGEEGKEIHQKGKRPEREKGRKEKKKINTIISKTD